MDNQRIINGIDAEELLNHLLESFDKILTYAGVSKGIRMRLLADIRQKETFWIEWKISESDCKNKLLP